MLKLNKIKKPGLNLGWWEHAGRCRVFYCWALESWEWSESRSVVSDSLWPHGLYSPWNSPGQNTGVGSQSFSRGSSQPRDWTQVACIAGRFFTVWAVREAHVNSSSIYSSSINKSSHCFHGTLQFVWFCFEPIYVDSAVCTISYCSV